MTIFERIKELADKQGKSLQKVSEDLGLSQNYIYNLKGAKSPAADKLALIANYFNVSVDHLLGVDFHPLITFDNIPVEVSIERNITNNGDKITFSLITKNPSKNFDKTIILHEVSNQVSEWANTFFSKTDISISDLFDATSKMAIEKLRKYGEVKMYSEQKYKPSQTSDNIITPTIDQILDSIELFSGAPLTKPDREMLKMIIESKKELAEKDKNNSK